MFDRSLEYTSVSNLTFIENLYSTYLKDANCVHPSWQRFFEGMAFGASFQDTKITLVSNSDLDKRILNLIEAYRLYGHLSAQFNPISLNQPKPEEIPELQIEQFGFTPSEGSKSVPTAGLLQKNSAPLSEMLKTLQSIYCGSVGFDYMGMHIPEVEMFIQQQIEPVFKYTLSHEEKMDLLHQLNVSEALESFIQIQYPGQKRFSIEGGETLIPIMNELINEGGERGVETIVIGMAHRGRLNVLSNVLRKSYATIFHEFETSYIPDSFEGSGDVKYHRGSSASVQTNKDKQIHLVLAANPSHLESVNPVVEGQVRALQEKKAQGQVNTIVPVLVHGDAAITGQGVVYETTQLCKIPGYATGGTIHLVVNNQIGFTANPDESRSTFYCTDLAKGFRAPVFHLNAENPESCVLIARLAMRLRQKFLCDVFIDMNCYRKYGHNETDEPSFTQPLMYQMIKERKNIRDQYRDFLISKKELSHSEIQKYDDELKVILEKELSHTKTMAQVKTQMVPTKISSQSCLFKEVVTGVPINRLKTLIQRLNSYPSGFDIHLKVKRILEGRVKALEQDSAICSVDWATAETLAYATLLFEGVHVRLSGQDSGRGTFSHRHAILVDQKTQERYIPLNHINKNQAQFHIYNSPLSEYAIMGFEYGYSLAYEKSLVIWEAQFGDFANGAQIMIDQYVVSAEQKWGNRSSLTLLLPHGYEGMGPDHSSARLERFLQLASDNSIYVVVPSCASQFFHALRRQGMNELKKPLVLLTPKGLLRFPPSASAAKTMGENTCFQELLDDPLTPRQVGRLIFCTGKVFYDLAKEREKRKVENVAIIRLEQLYPFHKKKVEQLLNRYQGFSTCYWVQEEHQNMGAWDYVRPRLQKLLPKKIELRYAGRSRSASTAAGFIALHKSELNQLLNQAFA